MVSVLVRRRLAACAFPRPSATASARLAKMTVSHSHRTTDQANRLGWMTASTVVSTAPTSTTNMTGMWTMTRGSSLRTASGSDVTSIFGSTEPARTRDGDVGGSAGMSGGPSSEVWGLGPLGVEADLDITG